MIKFLPHLYFIFIFGINITFSQPDFKEGYVLLPQNDTLFGLINDRTYYLNSQSCEFKKPEKGDIEKYSPEDIYGYRFIDGKYYVSEEIKSENGKSRVFLEYLVKGELEILYYNDENKSHHYYAKKDDTIFELKYSKEVEKKDGKRVYRVNKEYIGVLNYLTKDAPEIQGKISKLEKPDHKGLITIAKDYHNLAKKDVAGIAFEKQWQKQILLGLYTGYNFFTPYEQDGHWSYRYSFGANILFKHSKASERSYIGIGYFYGEQFEPGIKNYRIPISFHYMHPKEKFSPYFSYNVNIWGNFTQALNGGLNYRYNKFSLQLIGEIKTGFFVFPYGYATRVAVLYELF